MKFGPRVGISSCLWKLDFWWECTLACTFTFLMAASVPRSWSKLDISNVSEGADWGWLKRDNSKELEDDFGFWWHFGRLGSAGRERCGRLLQRKHSWIARALSERIHFYGLNVWGKENCPKFDVELWTFVMGVPFGLKCTKMFYRDRLKQAWLNKRYITR